MVTSKLYLTLKEKRYSEVALYVCENDEIPDGFYVVRLGDQKVYFENGMVCDCNPINLSVFHTIVFQPDGAFKAIGTGRSKEINVLDIPKDEMKTSDDAFILISEEEGPSSWKESVLDDIDERVSVLDFGGDKVIEVAKLI
jgi:hypothetical protein